MREILFLFFNKDLIVKHLKNRSLTMFCNINTHRPCLKIAMIPLERYECLVSNFPTMSKIENPYKNEKNLKKKIYIYNNNISHYYYITNLYNNTLNHL